MGAPLAPSTTKPNVLVIGDSVSIGYAPDVTQILLPSAKVQHSPYDYSDGGAGHVGQGITCLDRWLVTQAQQQVKWDIITFNFGLHELSDTTLCKALYEQQLNNITSRLMATGAKLLYVATTPFMPLRTKNITIVEDLNIIASAIMDAHDIPVVDLYR